MPRISTLFDPRTAIPWVKGFWADDPSWVQKPSNGQPVSTWRNFGSTAGDAEPSTTGGGLPTFRSSTSDLNGRGSLEFAITTRLLADWSLSSPSPCSVVVVLNYTSNPGVAAVIWSGSTSAQVPQIAFHDATYNNDLYMHDSTQGVSSAPTAFASLPYQQLIRATFSNNGVQTLQWNNDVVSGVGSGVNCNKCIIGSYRDRGTYSFGGQIAFLGIYLGDVSTHAKWPNFKEWVRSYYGIAIARGSV